MKKPLEIFTKGVFPPSLKRCRRTDRPTDDAPRQPKNVS